MRLFMWSVFVGIIYGVTVIDSSKSPTSWNEKKSYMTTSVIKIQDKNISRKYIDKKSVAINIIRLISNTILRFRIENLIPSSWFPRDILVGIFLSIILMPIFIFLNIIILFILKIPILLVIHLFKKFLESH